MTIPTAEPNVFVTDSQTRHLANALPSKTQPMLFLSVITGGNMTEIKCKLMQFAMLALLGMSITFSVGQLAQAQSSVEACGGLQCTAQEDCGGDAKKCFCNRPAGGCFAGDLILD